MVIPLNLARDLDDDAMTFANLSKLVQYMSITKAHAEMPPEKEGYFHKVMRRKAGLRDDMVTQIDPEELGPRVATLLKHILLDTGRYELALERLPNLRSLDNLPVPEEPVPGCMSCSGGSERAQAHRS